MNGANSLSTGSRYEKGDGLVDGIALFSSTGVPLRASRAKQTEPKNKWTEDNGVKLVPDL